MVKREAHAHRCRDCRQMYVCGDATCRGQKPDACEECQRKSGQQELGL